MKILIDMNLSPEWIETLENNGFEAVHWSSIGDTRAKDTIIMDYARLNQYVVFTHDLDFGSILAITRADSPSVIQVRTQDVTPNYLEKIIVDALKKYELELKAGSLIIIDENKLRVRILPLI
jgi:predicted nuclease of predicted toxin-antitoxin system